MILIEIIEVSFNTSLLSSLIYYYHFYIHWMIMIRQADADSSLARTLIESMQMQVKVYKEWIEGE